MNLLSWPNLHRFSPFVASIKSLASGCALTTTLVAFSSIWLAVGAAAQEWPTRPITMVVKYSAGGGTDLLLRALAKGMEEKLGQRINVINTTGGVGSIAAQYVYDRPADGYTWLGFGNFLKHFRSMDLVQLTAWSDFETFLVGNSLASWSVAADSPIKSFEDFIERAKANPGKIRVATDGKGGLWHEVMSMLSTNLGIKVNLVTYDGGSPATLAVLQKEVDVVCSGLHEHIEFIKAKKLRNLAQFSAQDIEAPGVGTLRSITTIVPATKDMAPFGSMYGIALKRDTPKPILMKVKGAIEAALQNPAFTELLEKRFLRKAFLYGNEADRKAAQLEVLTANLFSELGIAKKTPAELKLPADKEFGAWWPPAGYKPSVVD
jgi:tripartite-type tricarboxylate transporter receptor subunit TctC